MSSDSTPLHWFDGTLHASSTICLDSADPALLYGATVFTTLRVYQQSLSHPLTQWQAHCDRLRQSVHEFSWCPPNWQRMREGAEALCDRFAVLRITVFPDGREWITGRDLPPHLDQWQQNGIAAWLAPHNWSRTLPHHKTGNYLMPWLARTQAQNHNATEAILTNTAHEWLETATGNLWGWQNGRWCTPPLQAGILPGIMRDHLVSWLKCQNESISEAPWTLDWVQNLEALALSNSVVRMVPIHTVITKTGRFEFSTRHPQMVRLIQQMQSQG